MIIGIILGAIIQLLLIICFFVLVARVGAIKRIMERPSSGPRYVEFYQQGELAEFLGKRELATEQYRSAQFFISRISAPSDADRRNQAQIEKKLNELIG